MKNLNLLAVDKLEIQVLVDNVTDGLSTNPDNVRSEWEVLSAQGRLQSLSGRATCCAHHGLSLLISVSIGAAKHVLLFDTGPEGPTFIRNADILGIDFSTVEAVVLSHGHWDHVGGLVPAIEMISKTRGRNKADCYVHPDMFAERAIKRLNGELLKFEPVPTLDTLANVGANVVNTREPQVIAGGAFYLSGEIPRVTKYETGFPGHVRSINDGQSWEPDPLIMDERFVLVQVKDKGQFIFSACSHAGLINILTHARSVFPSAPLYGVMGGFHLSGSTEKIIPETIADLKQFDLKFIAPGHCTGWRALGALASVFDEKLVPMAVGKRYIF